MSSRTLRPLRRVLLVCAAFASLFLVSPLDAQLISPAFFKHRVSGPLLQMSSATPTPQTYICSGPVTVVTEASNFAATNVGSNLTVNLSGPGGVTFYSDAACSSSTSTVTVTTGTSSSSFYFISTSAGTLSLTAAAAGYSSGAQTEIVTANQFRWTGGGGNANWSTGGNWSGGAAPGSTNLATFESSCASNCSPTIDASIDIGGLYIGTGYAGTITQGAGNSITIESLGWTQLGGTFTGSAAGILSNNSSVTIAGGTFTAGAAEVFYMYASGHSWTILNSPTVNWGTGTLTLDFGDYSSGAVVPGTITYNNITINNGNGHGGCDLNATGTWTIAGNLTVNGYCNINTVTINLGGNGTFNGNGGSATVNVVGNAGGQTLTGSTGAGTPNLNIAAGANTVTISGTLGIYGTNYTLTSGTLVTTGSTLNFYTWDGNTTAITPGTATYKNVSFYGSTHGAATYNLTGTFTIGGTLTMTATVSDVINGGTLAASGNVTFSGGGIAGTTNLSFTGTATQTLTATGTTILDGNYTVNESGAGKLVLASAVTTGASSAWTVSAGSIYMSSRALTVKSLVLTGTTVHKKNTSGTGTAGVLTVNGATIANGAYGGGTVAN